MHVGPCQYPHGNLWRAVLGIGGDNTAQAVGTFYEGAITKGLSSDAADDAVQASIVAARYGQ